ncbi:hypothetical protein BKA65DRAFT_480116 [Rhexocercosporidium sp. MPI-PUGE-AT-0058]|nr:hypothetical protein BKA65DRAFT_480116 [Rhexocercosporidium sp. MPI-PUGE-AT-0058]
MVKFVLMIIYFTASPIVLFCLLFSQIQGCEFFCLGPESHIKKVITVPPWIFYKLPLLHLACMTLAFNQGYGMRVWTISRNASPNDVAMDIRTNISRWVAFSRRNYFWKVLIYEEDEIRLVFAEHLASQRCTGMHLFGPLPMIISVSAIFSAQAIPLAACKFWSEDKLLNGETVTFGEREIRVGCMAFVYILFSGALFHKMREHGWSFRLGRFGREIHRKALQGNWDLGPGYENPKKQMMWWIEMLLVVEEDDIYQANERFREAIMPVLDMIPSRPECYAEEFVEEGALEAGFMDHYMKRRKGFLQLAPTMPKLAETKELVP